jgi:hypothetical protein
LELHWAQRVIFIFHLMKMGMKLNRYWRFNSYIADALAWIYTWFIEYCFVVATKQRGCFDTPKNESRLFFVDKLIDMGAKIMLCDPHRAVVMGHDFQSQLKATTMSSRYSCGYIFADCCAF